jgi:SAM-dependent methyltransferase
MNNFISYLKLFLPPVVLIASKKLFLTIKRIRVPSNFQKKQPKFDKNNVYLYYGSMRKEEPQYSNPKFMCLALEPKSVKEIKHNAYDKLNFPENSIAKIQSQDVFEHLDYNKLPAIFDDIYRVLKKGGVFRLSMPDYNCPAMRKECVFDENGNIMVDISCGGSVIYDRSIPGKRAHFIDTGDAHLWFPTFENLKSLINKSEINNSSKITFYHYWLNDEEFHTEEVPDNEMFVQRIPPFDMRENGRPISIVVDFCK